MNKLFANPLWLFAALAGAALAIFTLDLLFPLRAMIAVAYLPILFFSLWFERSSVIAGMAIVCFGLTLAGHLYSAQPSRGFEEERFLGLGTIALTAVMILWRAKTEKERQRDVKPREEAHLKTMVAQKKVGHTTHLVNVVRELETQVAEQKQHTEEKLRQERLAVAGGMAAKFAHEIRNPLSSIVLNLDLVGRSVKKLAPQGGEIHDDALELLEAMKSELQRINRITDQYLRFSKPPTPNRQTVSLNDLLTRELIFLQAQFDKYNVTVTTNLDQHLPQISADEDQIWQAILNLIRNSLGAMRQGGDLTLQTGHSPEEVTLTIADTGVGMSRAEREQIFETFYSARDTGIGLGLPISVQIMKEHGGRIECQSEVGKGTQFILHWPRLLDLENANG